MTLGPLLYILGWALPNFQAKNQYVVVPLSYLLDVVMQKQHGLTYAVIAWDSVGFVVHT